MKGNSNAALISLALVHLSSSSVTAFAPFTTTSTTSTTSTSINTALAPSIALAASNRNAIIHTRASQPQTQTRVNGHGHGHGHGHASTQTQTRRNMNLFASPSDNETETETKTEMTSFEKLKAQANKIKLEAEKLEAELNLSKINKLEAAIKASDSLKDDDARALKRLDIRSQIKALASRVDPSVLASLEDAVGIVRDGTTTTTTTTTATTSNVEEGTLLASAMQDALKEDDSPFVTTQTNLYAKRRTDTDTDTDTDQPTITEEELTAAILYYASLPIPMRRALAKSIDLDERMADPAIIVLGLYELAGNLSDEMLARLYQEELLLKEPLTNDKSINGNSNSNNNNKSNKETLFGAAKMVQEGKEPDDPFMNMKPFSYPDASNPDEVNSMVENFLPRQTRKEGTIPTKSEVEVFTINVLGTVGKDTFQQSGKPEPISGGFLIRGMMAPKLKNDGDLLIQLLDEKIDELIPQAWSEKYQVSYMTDPTPQMLVADDMNGAAVLVVHSRDMSPSASTLLNTGVSVVSIFLTTVFAISIFGHNDVVMQRLNDAQGQSDYDLSWFNSLVTPFLFAIGFTQASHELAHLAVAKTQGFKITPPTILPLVSLPYMSFQNRIKTSPKNLPTLFNFAFIGPAVGMIVSFVFLITGLQMTLELTPEQVQYAASVPVGFLQLSSLGANIVDYVIGGGDGLLLQQDPTTPVLLHPFAIAGLAGLMINALDTIPLAGTDGGRMSQALLGRPGHVAFSGLTYIAILLYCIFSGHQDIFLTYLFVTSFTQKDLEIPARNEVDQAGLGQAAIALTMWCVAILALTPTN